MAYVIAAPCIDVKDTACVDICPVDCIHPRKDEVEFRSVPQLYIRGDICICCGACVAVCPVSAIFEESELPVGMERFAAVNANWYVGRS
jgi:NAD-dependent dihydropyrimidine dehydrogenase PreA subunit